MCFVFFVVFFVVYIILYTFVLYLSIIIFDFKIDLWNFDKCSFCFCAFYTISLLNDICIQKGPPEAGSISNRTPLPLREKRSGH